MPKPFHLAWFTNFTPGDWLTPFSHGGSPWDGKFYVDPAQAMERACFDYIILEDTLMVSEAYGGTSDAAKSSIAGSAREGGASRPAAASSSAS